MFGGNLTLAGPIWAPINALVRACIQMYSFYGDDFKVECPTGSGQYMNLYEVGQELSNRMAGMFLRDHQGHRPIYGGMKKFQEDPNWKDLILFSEYFHGDNGAGLGASHQTGAGPRSSRPHDPVREAHAADGSRGARHHGLEKRNDMEAPGAHP